MSSERTIQFKMHATWDFSRPEIRALVLQNHVPVERGYGPDAYLVCEECTKPKFFNEMVMLYPCPYLRSVEAWEEEHPSDS